MSDFLYRLAQRSLGLAETLDASTPGFFGPIESHDALDLDQDQHLAPTRPAGSPTLPSPVAGDPQRPLALQAAPPRAFPQAPERSPVVQLAASSSPGRPQGGTQERLADAREPAVFPASTTRHTNVMSTTSGVNSETATHASIVPAAVAPFQPLLPRNRQQGVQWPATPPAQSQTSTTIKVSIGRVEVRVVPETAKRPERQRVAPSDAARLSLSEYLRQGAGTTRGQR